MIIDDVPDEPEGLSALQALVGELAVMYVGHDPRFRDAFRQFCADRDADNSWRVACLELLVLLSDGLLASQGQRLTHVRLVGSVEFARELAAEEVQR